MTAVKNIRPLVYRRTVVKVGTSLITGGGRELDRAFLRRLVAQVARLQAQGGEVIIVSSGAVALGMQRLGLQRRQRGASFKQVMAAVGQTGLMHLYEGLFRRHGITVAQALLTRADLTERNGYLNARNTLLALLEMGTVTVVNENDVVAVDELADAHFGDNDNLSALVANLVDADLLVLLSDIEGLCTVDPNCEGGGCLIPEVGTIDATIEKLAKGTRSQTGTGGMVTKIQSARLATASGVRVVIASGRRPNVVTDLVRGTPHGTHFLPQSQGRDSRQRWMLSGLATRGRMVVDAGAAAALRGQQRSLLPAGVSQVSGAFERGDIVELFDPAGNHIGCGLTAYGARDAAIVKGAQSSQIDAMLGHNYGAEMIHRNNLVMIGRQV
jgi:glutamate 5-kinase